MADLSLIKLKTTDWHFKLNAYVYGNKIINANLRNLCPYFWMLIAAIPIAPIKFILSILFVKPIKLVKKFFKDKTITKIKNWINSADEAILTSIWQWSDGYVSTNGKKYNAPSSLYKLSDSEKFQLQYEYAKTKLNIDLKTESGREAWEDYLNKLREKRYKLQQKLEKEYKQRCEKERIREEKAKIRHQKIIKFFDSIATPFNWFFKKLKQIFTFNSIGKIVKTIKAITGAIITALIGCLLYLAVQGLTLLIMLIIKNWTAEVTEIMLYVLGVLAAGTILYFIIYGLHLLANKLEEKYRYNGEYPRWFTIIREIATYLIYYPLLYLVYYPIYGIFVSLLWKTICVAIIWNSFKSFFKGLQSVSGVFGEYFGKAKGDFCPGITWEDVDKK